MPGAWLEPKDVSSLVDFHSIRARPLSWPSIMPLSPDLPCETTDSSLDFRAAADLVRDYHSMDSLPALQRDDHDGDTSDTASLRTPLRSHAPAPFDFALRSTWSDSDSDSDSETDAECELDCDFSSVGCDGAAALAGVAFPRLPGERVSVASLSLFPSPPGTPAFGERFGARSPEKDSPATPKRPRRSAVPHPYAYTAVVEPESPTLRTARIRRETLARLESRV